MTASVRFLGVDFARLDRSPVDTVVDLAAGAGLSCVVTPNADHAVRLAEADPLAPYATTMRRAALSLCDSRVLRLLARPLGRTLDLCTGADLTRDLLARAVAEGLAVALVGPTPDQAERLRGLYPGLGLRCIDTPRELATDPSSLSALADRIEAAPWQILLIGLGAPKQEAVAACLADRARRGGVVLCIGAAVDYLTGAQRRAPVLMQRCCLEWLFRLTTQRRLRGRYLGGAPRLAALLLRTEILPRLKGTSHPVPAAAVQRAEA